MRNPSRPDPNQARQARLDLERHRPVISRPAQPGIFQGWGIRL